MAKAVGGASPVYTVCDESRYLIVRNVPALGCIDELVNLFKLYGSIEEYRLLDEEECEPFTDVYWIKFVRYSNARFAKRKLDDYKFLGNLLQVTYAAEHESPLDTRNKMEERRIAVLNRIKKCKVSKPSLIQHTLNGDSLLQSLTPGNGIHQSVQSNKDPLIIDSIARSGQHSSAPSQRKYFHSSSMNATVQSVRQKLDHISSAGRVPRSSVVQDTDAEPSNMFSSKQVDKIQERIVDNSAQKKPRLDNRRRI